MNRSRSPRPRALVGVFVVVVLLGVGSVIYWALFRTPAPRPETGTTTGGWTLELTDVGLAPLGRSCSQLPPYSGDAAVPPGTVISGVRVTTALDLSAGGIVLENSCVQPTAVARGLPVLTTQNTNTMQVADSKVIIRNSEIDGSALTREEAAWATAVMGNADVIGNYIHGFGSGIAVMNSGDDLDVVVERNYVTGLVGWGDPATTGNHSDAFTVRDFTAAARADRRLVVRDNRFDCDSDNATGAAFIQAYSGPVQNVLLVGNLLEGAGYQLVLEARDFGYTNMRAIDNRMTGTGWGVGYVDGGTGWTVWDANYRFDPDRKKGRGEPIPAL